MLETKLSQIFKEVFLSLYGIEPDSKFISFQKTRSEFEGDMTIVVFPFTKTLKKAPEQLANEIGQAMMEACPEIIRFNVVKGFLNLLIADRYWAEFLLQNVANAEFGFKENTKAKRAVIEYSSPNTNKPLHLGHIRNNLLGWSVAELLKANGYDVVKVNLINDRGIHICKSMIAWQKWGQKSPKETGLKGDKLVGDMYVRFDKEYKLEMQKLIEAGHSEEEAAKEAPLILEAQEMLRKWEAGDQEIHALWNKMNNFFPK